ncbi:hypothetical protein DBV14_09620 [Variovorax sp. KBW07]|nr:hypothetical protein DBV14_09620 [Variovorax sp. KBW07]
MEKHRAIELLGGSIASAAEAVGISYSAVYKWPSILPRRIVDRVEAAAARIRGFGQTKCTPEKQDLTCAPK